MTKSKPSVLTASFIIAAFAAIYLESVFIFHTDVSPLLRLLRVLLSFVAMLGVSLLVFRAAKSTVTGVFYAIAISATLVFAADVFLSHGTVLYGILFKDRRDTFMDFFNCVIHVNDGDPYALGCIYPPLAYMVFGIFYLLTPVAMRDGSAFSLRSSQLGMTEFFMFSLIVVLLMAFVLYALRAHSWRGMFFSVFTLFSPVFIFAFERGNIVTLAFALCAMFFLFKDSDNALVRHGAFIALALAAALKVYPAAFGMVLIIEKRYKDALWCVLYGIAAFFMPFLLFGGFSKVGDLWQNISEFSSKGGYHYRVDFTNTFDFFFVRIFKMGDTGGNLSSILSAFLILTTFFSTFFNREKWKYICALALLTAVAPGTSYLYSLIFMAIPLAMFLSKEEYCASDIIYAVIFAAFFVPMRFMNYSLYYENTLVTLNCIIERVAAVALAVTLSLDALICTLPKKAGKNL